MLGLLLEPPLVPVAANLSREAHDFNATGTAYDESSDAFTVYLDHRDLRGRRYPLVNTRDVGTFATERDYTDQFLLDGYYPRLRSGLLFTVTDESGESMDYELKGVQHNGDVGEHGGEMHGRTLLLLQRRFDRA